MPANSSHAIIDLTLRGNRRIRAPCSFRGIAVVQLARMLILDRLISRSSRSLAVMTGFARAGGGRGRGRWSGSPDGDGAGPVLFPPVLLPPFQPAIPTASSTDPLRRRATFAGR